jgi:4-amino-4-deoxy-L-arabinose transferase
MLSVSKGKLGTYILPCFAPLSLLFAAGLTQSMKELGSRSFRAAAWTTAVVAVLIAAVVIAMGFLKLTSPPIFAADETWKWAVASATFVAWSGASVASAWAKRTATCLGLFVIGPVILMLGTHFVMPKLATWSRTPEAFIMRHAGVIAPGDQIYSDISLAPAVSWVLKRSDIGILQGGGELQYGLSYPDAMYRQVKVDTLVEQIKDHNRTRAIILLVHDGMYSRIRRHLPEPTQTDRGDGFVIIKYVGRQGDSRIR